jgi:hypothetical protein
MILKRNRILFVKRREIHRGCEKCPITCSFQNTWNREHARRASVSCDGVRERETTLCDQFCRGVDFDVFEYGVYEYGVYEYGVCMNMVCMYMVCMNMVCKIWCVKYGVYEYSV